MRNVFCETGSGWIRLQQGAIFSGAVADGITGSQDLFGLVITPRCDIANRKVSTIHYLPLIPFKLWKYEILAKLYQSVEYDKLTDILIKFCQDNSITESLFENKYRFKESEIESSICHVKGYKDAINKYKERCQLENLEYCRSKVKDWSKAKTKIKDLIENKQAHYYLIEDWRNPNDYLVIMLRDVKRLDFELAEKMEKGLSERILSDEDFHKNDVFKSSEGTMVYKLQIVIGSPYLEHIMEAFSKNFCRIGIDRIDENVLNDLTSI